MLERFLVKQLHQLEIHNGGGLPYWFFIADNWKYFSAELKEGEAQTVSEAIGFGLYSNSRAGIDSFKSFFELIWNKPLTEQSLTEDEMRLYFRTGNKGSQSR